MLISWLFAYLNMWTSKKQEGRGHIKYVLHVLFIEQDTFCCNTVSALNVIQTMCLKGPTWQLWLMMSLCIDW